MSTGTPTPYLGLHTYDTLDDIVYAEINADNLAVDQAIAKLQIPTVTSATRPTADLYENKLIWESDTRRLMRYDGATWKSVSSTRYAAWANSWQNGAGGPNLAVGNGTQDSGYRQDGDHVELYFNLTRGNTTNLGTTFYTFPLPVQALTNADALGTGFVIIAGATIPVYIYLIDSNTAVLQKVSDNSRIGSASGAWTANDKIIFRGSYRVIGSAVI